jgi:hypothetical protein
MPEELRCVCRVQGEAEAEQIRSFLEAEGIASIQRGEALRKTHGLHIDGLARVEILVRAADAERATALLAMADAGTLRLGDDAGE